mgnify:CR=1 FL=1
MNSENTIKLDKRYQYFKKDVLTGKKENVTEYFEQVYNGLKIASTHVQKMTDVLMSIEEEAEKNDVVVSDTIKRLLDSLVEKDEK